MSTTTSQITAETENPARRWFLYGSCFTAVSVMAGIIYGWPALRQELLRDGCTLSESTLGAIFTVGAWSSQGGRFFAGLARDRFGCRAVATFCNMLVAFGCFGVAWCDVDDGAILGISMFSMGMGSGAHLCMQPVAGLFPNASGAVMSSLSGAFQISGLVFLALTSINASRKLTFTIYGAFLVFFGVFLFVVLPVGGSFVLEEEDNSVQDAITVKEEKVVPLAAETEAVTSTPAEDEKLCDSSHEGCKEDLELNANSKEEAEENQSSKDITEHVEVDEGKDIGDVGNDGQKNMHRRSSANPPPSAIEQLKSIEYIFLCSWFSFCLPPLQYYIGTIGFQLEEKGDDGTYTDLFAIVFAGSTIFAPAGGFLGDRLGLAITQGLSTAMCALSMIMLATDISLDFQVFWMTIYGLGRLLIFGMFFSNLGRRFGYANYGTLAGVGLLVSAIVSLLQYPLIALSADGKSNLVNICCGAFLLAQFPYFFWLHRREKA